MTTIKDVARASGVCAATVSNVLNNTRPVNPVLRERVIEAAGRLGYYPSAVGRSLVHKKINTLGVVFLHADGHASFDPYFVALMNGVIQVAFRERQNTTLYTSHAWNHPEALMPALCDGRCDGALLIVPPEDDALIPALRRAGRPFTLVGTKSAAPGVSWVDVDNTAGAKALTDHLIQLGHRRIALIDFADGPRFRYAREREAGYRAALERAGLPAEESRIALGPDGAGRLRRLLTLPPDERPTAVFAMHDLVACDILSLARDLGLSVPGDLSVVGFDDIPAAECHGLTTVRQPFHTLGARAAEILLEEIRTPAADRADHPGFQEILPTELIVRGSSAPPRA